MCRKERIRFKGKLGWTHYIHPLYINLRLDNGQIYSLVDPKAVEFVNMLDPDKPLEIQGRPCDVQLLGRTADKGYLIMSAGVGMLFDKDGYIIARSDGGPGVRLRNRPTKTCEYLPVTPTGAVVIGQQPCFNRQLAWDVHPEAQYLIQIDKTDGVVSGVGVLKRKA